MGWGRPEHGDDPYVGLSDAKPLFVLNDSGDRFKIPSSCQSFFQPESFADRKQPDEFHIFCFGGSTVQGRPNEVMVNLSSELGNVLASGGRADSSHSVPSAPSR